MRVFPGFSYCGTRLNDYGVVYLQGTGGALADMDIDCDGIQDGPGDDGRWCVLFHLFSSLRFLPIARACFLTYAPTSGSSSDTQAHTSFEDTVAGYKKGVSGLNAFVHTYVVFGNVGTNAGFVNYDPRADGVRELSLMAVVCGNGKMVRLVPSALSFLLGSAVSSGRAGKSVDAHQQNTVLRRLG